MRNGQYCTTSQFTVSILVPTWRRASKLKKCLQSLLVQTIAPLEILVSYRGEDIEGAALLYEMAQKYPRIKALQVFKEGVVHAENELMSNAVGNILAFIDDDAYAPPDWIERYLNFFKEHPWAGAVGGPDFILGDPRSYNNVKVNKVGRILWYGKVIGNHHHQVIGGVREVQILKGVNMVFRKEYTTLLDEKGLSGHGHQRGNGAYWELDMCLNAAAKGARLFFDPTVLVQHDSNHDHFIPEEVMRNGSHNMVWVLRKHLSCMRFFIFLFYVIFVGNTQVQGLLKTLHLSLILHRPFAWKSCWASMCGILSGLLAPRGQKKSTYS